MSQPARPDLPPFYYRDNFLALCATVEGQYGDLLTPQEQYFLGQFRQLGFDAQCLFVRLASRVGPWFRESRLAYAELGPIAPALSELQSAGLLELAVGLELEELAGLFTRAELLAVCAGKLASPLPRTKSELLAAVAALELDAKELLHLAQTVEPNRIIAPLGLAEVQVLQLLFFGNRRQGMTDFVLSDLGVARYYPYTLDRQHRLFQQREAVEEFIACADLGDSWYELRELGEPADLVELAAEMADSSVRYPSSARRWHRLCNTVARDLERLGELELARQLYLQSERHPARERRLRILERMEAWAEALQLAQAILTQPWCEEERDAAERVLPRVQRRVGASPAPRRRDSFVRLDLVLPQVDAPVELLAARALEANWAQVHYVENSLMNTLFGLAFWEQIFAPVPGAFHNPYQSVPADMYSQEFRERRLEKLNARLVELRAADLGSVLCEAYDSYAGFQCRWADWRRVDADLIATAGRLIPAAHLLAIWQRMLFDPQENRRGFPDLVAFGASPGEYSLIEVKGPGDALQQSQKRWLRFFGGHDIPAAVAWVSWEAPPDA